jgi:selenocysteine lyase/cysteine desulfurase
MLSTTGRKYLRGPRGTGFLYVRRELCQKLEPPFLDLHAAEWVAADRYEVRADARRFENWETNFAGKAGLAVAIDYARGWGLPAIWDRVQSLAALLRSRLREMSGVTVRDIGAQQCGIVTFTAEGTDARAMRRALAAQSINVTTSSVASTRFDMEARGLGDLIRASVHYYNDESEVERFCAAVAALIAAKEAASASTN